ncbi:MAG: flagellin [Clostridiaceae bacterium]
MRIYHNTASMNILKQYNRVLKKQEKSLSEISSGIKIKSAKDGPNQLSKGEKINMRIRGTQMAERNMQDGMSMLQTAEGGLSNITDMLQRTKELLVSRGNGSLSADDKKIVDNEIKSITEGIYSIADNTEFNGVKLLSGNDPETNIIMASGSEAQEYIKIPLSNIGKTGNMNLDSLYDEGLDLDEKLNLADTAMNNLISIRSTYGALESRFEGTYDRLSDIDQSLQGAESDLMDSDIAEETAEFSKYQILAEASNALMVQTNRMPSEILKILDR